MNVVVLVGRLTKDPELTYTPNGVAKARFTLAVDRKFSNSQGEKETDFISCIAWRKQAENLANFQRKGSLIGLEGRMQTGSYEGQDGKRVYTTDVVAESIKFLDSKSSSNNTNSTPQTNSYNDPNSSTASNQPYSQVDEDPFANSKGPIEVSEDDLPF